MGRKTETVLEVVSNVIVNVSQSCIASAVNDAIINVKGAREVVITGLTINSEAKTEANCQQSQDVQIGPIHDALRSTLAAKMTTGVNKIQGDTVKLAALITEAITVDVVSSCNALAINSLEIDIQNVKGNITIENLNVTQKAIAKIKQCIQKDTVRVGTVPLKQFIEQNEDQFEIATEFTEESTPVAVASGTTQQTLMVVTGVIVVLCVYLAILALGTSKYLKVW
jgi:hypothetical protein